MISRLSRRVRSLICRGQVFERQLIAKLCRVEFSRTDGSKNEVVISDIFLFGFGEGFGIVR